MYNSLTLYAVHADTPIIVELLADELVAKDTLGNILSSKSYAEADILVNAAIAQALSDRQKLVDVEVANAESLLGSLAQYLDIPKKVPYFPPVSLTPVGFLYQGVINDPMLALAISLIP